MAQYGIKEVMNFTLALYNPNPLLREPILIVDYAQITDIENGGDRIDISGGRGNKRLLSFDHSKTTAINVTLPLVDLKMLALLSGDEIQEKIKNIFKKETLIVKEDEGGVFVELKKEPMANSLYVYKLEGYRDLGKKLEPAVLAGTVAEGEYEIDSLEPKRLNLNAVSNPVGSEVVVFYHTTTKAPVFNLQVNPELFPKAISIYGDTLFRNQYTELDEVYNVVGHKGRIRPNYTLSMNATDVTVLELTIDMYAVKDEETGKEMYIEYIKDEDEE